MITKIVKAESQSKFYLGLSEAHPIFFKVVKAESQSKFYLGLSEVLNNLEFTNFFWLIGVVFEKGSEKPPEIS